MFKYNLRFWAAWVLTRDQNSIRLYRSCYSGSLKCGTGGLTQEWALARDTMASILKFVQNLERFLEKVFQEQTFLPTTTIVRSTENEVELLLPTEVAETQGYRISPLKECRVSFKVTEYYP